MKKLLILIVTLLATVSNLYAKDMYEKELPRKFRVECFEFSTSALFPNKNSGFFTLKTDKEDTIATRNGYLVPIIPYKQELEAYPYTANLQGNISFLYDKNLNTSLELDTHTFTGALVVEFAEPIKKESFTFNFKHTAKDFIPEVYISEDGENFFPISFSSIPDFDIKKFTVEFVRRKSDECKQNPDTCSREKIKIQELSFMQYENTKLMRVQSGGRIDFYSGYHCRDYINLDTIKVPFSIDVETPQMEISLEKNSQYNPNMEHDSDNDGIDNSRDNCPDIVNPAQKDADADGIGDLCSDVDNDGITGADDNCPMIANKDQIDINQNGVGDVCEFDKDKDEIYDSQDNCITVVNPFQKDSDKDGVGDLCDNCKYQNSNQRDEDDNGIGDVCDDKAKELAENDDDNDGIINSQDNCLTAINPDQADSDKDGIGDVCDNCINIQNTSQWDYDKNGIGDICEDSDGDGVEGIEDNCINAENPDQKDSDNNGVGDVCEDYDGDHVIALHDNCVGKYNPFQKDIDKDGIGDKCDTKDDRILESSSSLMLILLSGIALLFIGLIFTMIKKLKLRNAEDFSDIDEDGLTYTQKIKQTEKQKIKELQREKQKAKVLQTEKKKDKKIKTL